MDCGIGRLVTQRPLLSPRPYTFYSVDALNPDVVRRGRTYYMFFSGNRAHSPAGIWRTGVATSHSPLGPFRVRPDALGDFSNGGTTLWHGRFWQATSDYRYGNVLMASRDGRHWRRITQLPSLPAWPTMADFSLQRRRGGLRIYMLVRARNGVGAGGTIATLDWIGGRWRHFRASLAPGPLPWENLDLGEPAPIPDRPLVLYTATAAAGSIRTIGLARRTASGRWVHCSARPLIGAGAPWARTISTDPSALVEGDQLYVYYGGGSGTSIAADLGGAIGVNVYRVAAHRTGSVH
jgi:hypothetical protein